MVGPSSWQPTVIQQTRVFLTSAEILNLTVAPVIILPPPLANETLVFIAGQYFLTFGTIAYVQPQPLVLAYNNLLGTYIDTGDASMMTATNDVAVQSGPVTGNLVNAPNLPAGQAIVLTTAAPLTSGNGTVTVSVFYGIIRQ
jgi:hypothetical protein